MGRKRKTGAYARSSLRSLGTRAYFAPSTPSVADTEWLPYLSVRSSAEEQEEEEETLLSSKKVCELSGSGGCNLRTEQHVSGWQNCASEDDASEVRSL